MKNRQTHRFFRCLCILLLLSFSISGHAFAQSPITRLTAGIELFRQGRLNESVLELRRLQAEAPSRELRAEALFWISMAQLFAGEFEQALQDMAALEETDPVNRRLARLPYYRGLALFNLGRYDQAIVFLMRYADAIMPGPGGVFSVVDASRKVTALYWAGASLLSMGQLDRAADIFVHIIEDFPASHKVGPSNNRLAAINQRRIEAELLTLLRWSHEESLRNMEEFRRREMAYNQALLVYQRRIADMLRGTRVQELEYETERYRHQLRSAEDRIDYLERLLVLRRNAQELENILQDSTENFGGIHR
ncbi:MAG: tetratricopeptide repeat protein [Treponema sp.]|nr:tetratricopeptide repeat protein [Treponema sp.]